MPDTYFPGMTSDAPRDAMLRAMATGMAGAGNPYLAAARTGNHAARAHRGDAMEEDEFYGYGEDKYSDDEDDEYAEGDSTAKKTKLEAAQYEATHGIRRPDPIRQQRLVDDGPFMRREDPNFLRPSHNGRGSLDPAGVTWMFAPANDISYPGGFEEASFLLVY